MPKNTRQKRVCHLTSGHPPFDGRIFYKEARTLAKLGYDVTLIAQHDRIENVDGVRIIPLPKTESRFERMTRGAYRLFKLALKEKADVYHFHDPELIVIGILLRLSGRKVIYDVHELVSCCFEDKMWLKFKFLKIFFQYTYLFVEKLSLSLFDRFVLAEEGYEDYYKRNYKGFCNYTIIRNFPILSLIEDAPVISQAGKQKSVIIYAGGLVEVRGIKEIIQSMEFIRGGAELWLLGKWESKAFRDKCEQLKGWQHTKYLGILPLPKVYEYMKAADIGVSTLYPIKNYLTSLPTKVYEYMYCSLPAVVSNFPYWQEKFEQCAVFADPCVPEDIADKIKYLLDNPDEAKQLSDRAKQRVLKEWNWEVESRKLAELYKELLK